MVDDRILWPQNKLQQILPSEMIDNKRGLITYLMLFLAVVFWGFSFVATKIALQSFTPLSLIFFRFGAASLFFLLLLLRTGFPPLTLPNLKNLALLALFQPGLYFTFETIGLQYTSATKTSLIIATIPLVVLILSVIFLKEKLRLQSVAGILISLIGVSLLIFGGESSQDLGGALFGDLLICAAAIAASIYMLMTRYLGQTFTPIQITGMQAIFGAIIFFPPFLYDLKNFRPEAITPESIIALAALTVFATITAFLCYNYALTKIPADRASIWINAIPVVTASGAWLLLGETLTNIQLLGGATVLFAVYLTNRPDKKISIS